MTAPRWLLAIRNLVAILVVFCITWLVAIAVCAALWAFVTGRI